jgi:transcriptional regulator with XRE-family HTH domain
LATSVDEARAALGIRLRDLRRDAGLSATQLAAITGWQTSKISKIEHGKQTPSEADLSEWCRRCRAIEQLADLVAAVRSIETQFAEWRRILRSGTKRRQEESAKTYEKARLFRIWEPAVVPGLLQTREYATEILSVTVEFLQIPDDASEGAVARIERQRVLSHRDRRFHFLLGEQALRTNVGGPDVMAAQMSQLLDRLKLPHVRLGVVPADASYRVPLHNGFWILDHRLVQFDTYSAELTLVRPDEITLYSRAFERLTALALYGQAARSMIEGALPR